MPSGLAPLRVALRTSPAELAKAVRILARSHRGARGLPALLALARALWKGPEGEQDLALHLLSSHHRWLEGALWKEFKGWVRQARSPAILDRLAAELLGTLVRKDRGWCTVLRTWSRSPDARDRRAAAGALIPRVRQMADVEAALGVAADLKADRDAGVRGVAARLLKEMLSADRPLVREFLGRNPG